MFGELSCYFETKVRKKYRHTDGNTKKHKSGKRLLFWDKVISKTGFCFSKLFLFHSVSSLYFCTVTSQRSELNWCQTGVSSKKLWVSFLTKHKIHIHQLIQRGSRRWTQVSLTEYPRFGAADGAVEELVVTQTSFTAAEENFRSIFLLHTLAPIRTRTETHRGFLKSFREVWLLTLGLGEGRVFVKKDKSK